MVSKLSALSCNILATSSWLITADEIRAGLGALTVAVGDTTRLRFILWRAVAERNATEGSRETADAWAIVDDSAVEEATAKYSGFAAEVCDLWRAVADIAATVVPVVSNA
jgi:hypothetical protein